MNNLTTEQVRKTLLGLTLDTKPLSEAAFFKGIALILAGLDAHAKSLGGQGPATVDPDRFIDLVVTYMLKNPVGGTDNDDGGGDSDFEKMAKDLGL